jgi:hypothetical protein
MIKDNVLNIKLILVGGAFLVLELAVIQALLELSCSELDPSEAAV